jgi:hydrogenase-4 component F
VGWDLVLIFAAPLAVTVVCWLAPVAVGRALTVACGSLTFALAVALVPHRSQSIQAGWLHTDPLSIVFLLAVTFLYATSAVFSVGYVRRAGGPVAAARYQRHFFAGLNLFAWSMAMAPLVNNLALLWVAIEVTTIVSTLLVAIDNTDGAAEAAWKYILIASMGLGIALLATIVMYYAGTSVFGASFDPTFSRLLAGAHHFPPDVVRLAFVLSVLGYGTKMGLVPVHTWLPDAHSEAPTPISAMLSGALLAVSFYAILRFYELTASCLGPTFPRSVLLAFGIASLALAALYLAGQRDLKRLLAYSSIEHMGILAIGMSLGAPIAIIGVLLHVLAHAAAKGTAFFGAGSLIRKFGTKDLRRLRGGVTALPVTGAMFVLAVLALAGMPPFGIFRSEFLIVAGGLESGGPKDAVVAVLLVLVILATLGLTWFSTETMLTPTPDGTARGEPSMWIVASMAIGLVALVILGVHPPSQLSDLLVRAGHELAGST